MPVRVDAPPVDDDPFDFGPPEEADRPRPTPPITSHQRSSDSWVAWAGLISAVVLVLAGAYFARNVIVAFWPPAAKIYTTIGVPLSAEAIRGRSQLDFRNVEPSRIVENGETVLVVKGEIVNGSEDVTAVPEVRVIMRGDESQELGSWTFRPPEVRLVPNEIIRFETRYQNPPPETAGLTLVFLG